MVSAGTHPVVGASVGVEALEARSLPIVAAARTGTDGVAMLREVPFGRFRLLVAHPELAPHRRTLDVVAEQVELEVVLERGVRIDGKVLDSRRRPIAEANLRALAHDSDAEHARAVTDATGAFTLTGLDVGSYRLYVHTGRHKPRYEGPIRFERHGESRRVEFTLDEGRVLAGVVIDAERHPVAGARLGAADPGSSIVIADEHGRFELGGLGDEPVNIFATAEGFGPTHVSAVRPGARGLEIVLERAARLEGSVAFELPANKMMVSVCRHAEKNRDELCVARRLYEPAETRFSLEGLPIGSYELVLEADGHRVERVRVHLLPGRNFTVPLVSLVRAE